MSKTTPMTVAGAERLREELRELKQVKRPGIIEAIAEAREHGDLKENAEYHAAREQQSFCEGRIAEIEGKLAEAQIIDITKIPNEERVIFGVTVTLINVESEEQVRYQIVGDDEADVKVGKISISSPIARAMMGKEVGDEVVVKAPGGETTYEIEAVEHIGD
ncbi:MAG: transcription elongation factor GreA [Pseudomonadota bacterium]